MKCGKVEELVQWTVDAILDNPEAVILVATANRNEGREVIARITRELVDNRPVEITRGWKFGTSKIRTNEGGFIDLYSSVVDRPSRGWKLDHVFVSDKCSQRVLEAGQWLEKST